MPPLSVTALAVAVGQHRFWVSASMMPPFLGSMSSATRVVPFRVNTGLTKLIF